MKLSIIVAIERIMKSGKIMLSLEYAGRYEILPRNYSWPYGDNGPKKL